MSIEILTFKTKTLLPLCTVCITDNNGGKIALTIIVSVLVLLGVGNWAWKKYFSNKKEFSQEK
tara:strand:+ start:1415 stop:1603 length:189 start_codon:yes stop_codon:yes gene_type:complete